MNNSTRYSPEVRKRAVRMVFDHRGEYESEWSALTSISGKIGCTAETLRKWVRRPETDQGKQSGITSSDQLWVADIMFVATWAGFVYVAFIIDALEQAL